MNGVLIAPDILQAILAQASACGLSVNDYLRKILGLSEARSEDKKLAGAAQTLPYEQRKELIKTLFEQFPKPEPLAGSISYIGDLEIATIEIRQRVAKSIERSTEQLSKPEQ